MTTRVSSTFIKVAAESEVGADLWPRMRRIKTVRGGRGVTLVTMRSWERLGWVTVERGADRQARPVLAVRLTAEGLLAIVGRLREMQGAA